MYLLLEYSYHNYNSHFDKNEPNTLMEHIMILYLNSSTSISKSNICLYSNLYNGMNATGSCIVKETLMQNCYTEIIIMYSSNMQLIHDTMKIT